MALNILSTSVPLHLYLEIWSPHGPNKNQIHIKTIIDTKNQCQSQTEKDTRQTMVCVWKDRVFTLLLFLRLVATLPPLKPPLLNPVNIQANLVCGLLLNQQEINCQDISCFSSLDQRNYFQLYIIKLYVNNVIIIYVFQNKFTVHCNNISWYQIYTIQRVHIETIFLRNALICFTLPVNCLILLMHHFLDNGYSCLGSLFRGFNKGKCGFIFRKLLSVIGLVRLSILETSPS